MENIELTPEALVAVTVIATLVQQLKLIPWIQTVKQYAPVYIIVACALGIAYAYQAQTPEPVVTGIVIGLTAAGAYSTVRKKDT